MTGVGVPFHSAIRGDIITALSAVFVLIRPNWRRSACRAGVRVIGRVRERLVLQIEIAGEVEAAGTPDGAQGMLAARRVVDPREQAHLVVHADDGAAAVEGLQNHVPVALALLQVGLEVRHVRCCTLRCTRRLDLGASARRLVVEGDGPHEDEEGARHRQGELVGVADQGVHP